MFELLSLNAVDVLCFGIKLPSDVYIVTCTSALLLTAKSYNSEAYAKLSWPCSTLDWPIPTEFSQLAADNRLVPS